MSEPTPEYPRHLDFNLDFEWPHQRVQDALDMANATGQSLEELMLDAADYGAFTYWAHVHRHILEVSVPEQGADWGLYTENKDGYARIVEKGDRRDAMGLSFTRDELRYLDSVLSFGAGFNPERPITERDSPLTDKEFLPHIGKSLKNYVGKYATRYRMEQDGFMFRLNMNPELVYFDRIQKK